MKELELTDLQTADLCRELALLIHAGIGLGDGLALLAEEEKPSPFRQMLTDMADDVDNGAFLSQAMEKTGCFPAFLTGLVYVGETTGKLEESMNALAVYHENRDRMHRQLVSALTYPAVLLGLMLVVIVILLGRVLPVFNEIYQSLGGRLTGVAGGLLAVGQLLNRGLPFLGLLLVLVLGFLAGFRCSRRFRTKVTAIWAESWGDRGIARKWNNARFAQAMTMAFSSGLPVETAVEIAASLLRDVPSAAQRCDDCLRMLMEGSRLTDALTETDLLSPAAGRLLALGVRSGSGESAMEEISARMDEEARQALENLVSKVEPAMVLVTSVLVGIILMSVMLPLMNIMTAIG